MSKSYDDSCGVNGCKAIATTYSPDHKRFVCRPHALEAKAHPKLITKPGTRRCATCGEVMVRENNSMGIYWRHLNNVGHCLKREQAPHVFYGDQSWI